jgi:hypothetical protein
MFVLLLWVEFKEELVIVALLGVIKSTGSLSVPGNALQELSAAAAISCAFFAFLPSMPLLGPSTCHSWSQS